MRVLHPKNIVYGLFLSLSVLVAGPVRAQDLVIDDANASEPPPAAAPEYTTNGSTKETARELGLGMGSVLASVVYSPLKVTYAGLGLLTGGIGYVVSGGRSDVAKSIINPAVRGNYVITPSHLEGKERVIFVGPPPPPDAVIPPPFASADPPLPNQH